MVLLIKVLRRINALTERLAEHDDRGHINNTRTTCSTSTNNTRISGTIFVKAIAPEIR